MSNVVNLEPEDQAALDLIMGVEPVIEKPLTQRAIIAKQRLEAKEKIKAAKAALKVSIAKAKPSNRQPVQNGISYPKPLTDAEDIWNILSELSTEKGSPVTLDEFLACDKMSHYKKVTLKTQFIKWCLFYDIPLGI